MRIAFDGTVLHGRKSGVGYYTEELLKALVAQNHDDEFVVFSHQPLSRSPFSSNGNLKFANSVHCPARVFYLHALLPGVLDKLRPDLCHYTNFLAPVMDDRPYVVTIHDMGLETLSDAHPLVKRLYTRRLVPHTARKATLIVTNSEYSKWEIVRYLGIPEDRIRVTPLAASSEFVPQRRDCVTQPYFLYVGNIEPRKNLERLIEAFARVPDKQHQLLIAGNRWYQGSAPVQKAKSLGLNGRVKFLGYVPREDLQGLYSNATAFVYPSLLEGFGLPVVEAMACGTPVITSNNSSMQEVAGQAAVLVDPRSVNAIAEALTNLAESSALRDELSGKGLQRASEFSWAKTAELTMEVYREALSLRDRAGAPRRVMASENNATSPAHMPPPREERELSLEAAIQKTIEYAKLFQYPLMPDELRERLFEVRVDKVTFTQAVRSLRIEPDSHLLQVRDQREKISDAAIHSALPRLKTLAAIPFVRMIAFSGSTAHRNMTPDEDVDLFIVVEDGKLWAVFLAAMLWSKLKGLRKQLCMNYLITDAALPLFEHDVFTAQQVASLKPVYGKSVYDEFLAANPFVWLCFPNFEPARHRDCYREIRSGKFKQVLEWAFGFGPVQIVERLSRFVLRRYFSGKETEESELVLDARRLKLHLRGHKQAVLNASPGSFAGTANHGH